MHNIEGSGPSSKYWIKLSTGQLVIQWTTPMILCTSCLRAIQTKNEKKGLLSSVTFQVIFHAVQFICCDLQMIYDQSFCYLCVGAGNLCLHFLWLITHLFSIQLYLHNVLDQYFLSKNFLLIFFRS